MAHIVQHDDIGAGIDSLPDLIQVLHLDFDLTHKGRIGARHLNGLSHAARRADVIVLQENTVRQVVPVIMASAHANRVFFEDTVVRRCLPGVKKPDARALKKRRSLTRTGRDAAQPLKIIQCRSFAGKQHADISPHLCHPHARFYFVPISDEKFHLCLRIQEREHPLKNRKPADACLKIRNFIPACTVTAFRERIFIMTTREMQDRIIELKRERDVCILAHAYQSHDIWEVADYIGDSYGLSVQAAKAPQHTLLMCGVRFMAETCKILSPDKKVLLANPMAGCPMAMQMNREQALQLKAENPGLPLVAYINTTASLKTVCDVVVTSSSAVKIIGRMPEKEMLFIPDCNVQLSNVLMRNLSHLQINQYIAFPR
jgi:hypothetical protein